jgi:hypothetical protein
MAELGSEAEAHMAVERLMDKLEAWVVQQPEALLIWAQSKHVRKLAAREIAVIMTNIPTRNNPEAMNREQRKRLLKALEAEDKKWFEGIGL